MRILVADGDPGLAALVAAALGTEPGDLVQALDGVQAMAAFREQQPDLVIADLDLARINGLDLSRLIRLGSRRRVVPVLLLAAAESAELRRQGLQAGVLEVLARPFQAEDLRLRVLAMHRLTRLQNDLLIKEAQGEEELELIRFMLARLTESELPPAPGFRMRTLHTRRINGDACLHRQGLPGIHYGLICDATGHGLMAGVSTLPVIETFLSMAGKDLPLERIHQEIHGKLKRLLPTGHFACLLLLRLDVAQGVLSVLNAGMPDALLLRDSGALQRFPSRMLPAGIPGVQEEPVVTEAGVGPGDRLLAFSDGLGDLVSPEAIEARYLRTAPGTSHEAHCQQLLEQVRNDTGGREHLDDVSWALWQVPSRDSISQPWAVPAGAPAPLDLIPGLRVTFQLDPRVHSLRELVPHVLGLLQSFQVSHARAQLFAMLLGEALSNAWEHGLLALDSRIKQQGFEAYEEHLRAALARLQAGSASFTLTLFRVAAGPPGLIRRLQAEVEDSGAGFDWRPWLQPAEAAPTRPFGRGLALLAALGQGLAFNEAGNQVTFYLDLP